MSQKHDRCDMWHNLAWFVTVPPLLGWALGGWEGKKERNIHVCHSWPVVSCITPVTHLWRILDPFWVTLWKSLTWLPQVMYIFSHTKGTYFPLARISIMIPPFHSWDHVVDLVTEWPASWVSPSLLACKAILSPGELIITMWEGNTMFRTSR